MKLILHTEQDRERAHRMIDSISLDKPKAMSVEPYSPQRSDPQHRTFWLFCGQFCRQMQQKGVAMTQDEAHDLFLGGYFGWTRSELVPQYVRPKRTLTKPKRPSKAEMSSLLDWMAAKALDYDCQLFAEAA